MCGSFSSFFNALPVAGIHPLPPVTALPMAGRKLIIAMGWAARLAPLHSAAPFFTQCKNMVNAALTQFGTARTARQGAI